MPFRCLDAQYRRELVRVYLSNVESICRKFVEERRGVLVRLKDGPVGLAAFLQALDLKQRHLLASEHGDVLLKVAPRPCNMAMPSFSCLEGCQPPWSCSRPVIWMSGYMPCAW